MSALATRLHLTRPIAFLDLETTGKYPERDRIIEITMTAVAPDGETFTATTLVNPTIPIPAAATAIHGITDEMVLNKPTFADLAPRLAGRLAGMDLAGYNITRFDAPLLVAEFRRVDPTLFSLEGRRLIDPQVIFFKREPRDLSAALKFFTGTEAIEDAHRTAADVAATIAVLVGQLERYPDLPTTVNELAAYCNPREPSWVDEQGKIVWVEDEACIGFGKKAGKSLRWLAQHEPDYLGWLLRSDFPEDVKALVRDAGRGKFPTHEVTT